MAKVHAALGDLAAAFSRLGPALAANGAGRAAVKKLRAAKGVGAAIKAMGRMAR